MSNLDSIAASRHLISAGHYLATQAGFDVLSAGGNAIDAGVASNLALGVLQSDQVNVAGVAPMMIYEAATATVHTLAGVGPWPAAARLEYFVNECGGEVPVGLLRTVVPAAPDAHILALERFGTMSFGEVAAPATRYAREGFPMHALMGNYISAFEERYRRWPSNASIYLPEGRPPRPGELFIQSDLARSLQYMADEESAVASKGREAGLAAARNAFYRGDIAKAILDFHKENGGLLTANDLESYHTPIVPPVSHSYTGLGEPLTVYTCGPWCQGPVLLQMLALVDGMDLHALGHNSAPYLHVLAESIKLAFADREQYFGDPEHVDVPLDALLAPDYIAARRAMIDSGKAWPQLPPPGEIWPKGQGVSSGPVAAADQPVSIPGDTSYTCVVDAQGNVFSSNPSDVTWESPVIPGTGLCPSSRGTQSWAVTGHASAVAPGKRPRLTPNPAMFRRNGGPLMPIGTPGGDVQPQAMLQVLLNLHCFGMPVQAAIDAPRIVTHSQPNSFAPHTAYPGRVEVESEMGAATIEAFEALGHAVEVVVDKSYKAGGICLIDRDPQTGTLWGGADRRRPAQAMGW